MMDASPLKRLDNAAIRDLSRFPRTNLINSLSGFKSVCLCGTRSPQGHNNLSVISSVIHVGANPPYMGMLIRPHSVPRHTLENLLATGTFTLNHIREDFYEQAHQTAARYPSQISEFEAAGLHAVLSDTLDVPYVAESHIRIGLRFREQHQLLNDTVLVVGEVEELFFPEIAWQSDGYLDLAAAGTLTIAGLDAYHKAAPLARMAYAKPDLPPRKLD